MALQPMPCSGPIHGAVPPQLRLSPRQHYARRRSMRVTQYPGAGFPPYRGGRGLPPVEVSPSRVYSPGRTLCTLKYISRRGSRDAHSQSMRMMAHPGGDHTVEVKPLPLCRMTIYSVKEHSLHLVRGSFNDGRPRRAAFPRPCKTHRGADTAAPPRQAMRPVPVPRQVRMLKHSR